MVALGTGVITGAVIVCHLHPLAPLLKALRDDGE